MLDSVDERAHDGHLDRISHQRLAPTRVIDRPCLSLEPGTIGERARRRAGFPYDAPMIRIQGGEYRSRLLDSPEGEDRTRPMTSRVKESLFNLLRGWFDGARVLDLFSGIGTMGLEAASRGAAQVVCIESDREVFRYLQRNITSLDCGNRVSALQGDALGPLAVDRAPKPVDIVFLDPPYAMMLDAPRRRHVLNQLARLRTVMADKGFVVLRSPVELPPGEDTVPGFTGPELHEYGREMRVMLYLTAAQAAETTPVAPTDPARIP